MKGCVDKIDGVTTRVFKVLMQMLMLLKQISKYKMKIKLKETE